MPTMNTLIRLGDAQTDLSFHVAHITHSTLLVLSGHRSCIVVIVVVWLFYVHGKHLRLCWDGQLT